MFGYNPAMLATLAWRHLVVPDGRSCDPKYADVLVCDFFFESTFVRCCTYFLLYVLILLYVGQLGRVTAPLKSYS